MILKSFVANNMNNIHIFFCILGAIGCLLPLYFEVSYVEKFEISRSLASVEFTIFSAVSFTLTAPLILDQIVELIIYASSNERNIHLKSSIKILFLTDVERMLFVFGVLIIHIITVIPVNDLYFTYLCCLDCQYVLTVGMVTASINRYDKGFFPTIFLSLSIVFLILSSVIHAFFPTDIFHSYGLPFIFNVVSSVLLVGVCLFHLFKIFRKTEISSILYSTYHGIKMESKISYDTNKNKEDVFVVVYIGYILVTCFLMAVVAGVMYPRLMLLGATPLILSSLPFSCFVLFLDVLLMRIAKSEMTDAVVSFHVKDFLCMIYLMFPLIVNFLVFIFNSPLNNF